MLVLVTGRREASGPIARRRLLSPKLGLEREGGLRFAKWMSVMITLNRSAYNKLDKLQRDASLQLAGVGDGDALGRLARAAAVALDLLHDIHPAGDVAEHDVLAYRIASQLQSKSKIQSLLLTAHQCITMFKKG